MKIGQMMITRYDPGVRYSRALSHNGTLYVAGITADDKSGGIVSQTRSVLDKIDHCLATGGSSKSHLLSVTIWLADIGDFDAMNTVWDSWIDPQAMPVRATVQALGTGQNCLIEIMVTAAIA